MTSLTKAVQSISSKGRGEDSLSGHLSPGDIILPKEIHNPELLKAVHKHFAQHGASADQYTAGHKENSINPETGMPEFSFLKKLFHNPITKILTDVGLSLIPGGAPFIPLANAAETKIGGGSNLDALKSGGEAFAGQEIAGAAANFFPETAGELGVTDTGGNSLTDAIGRTTGAGSFTGPGTIGGSISGLYNSATGSIGNAIPSLGAGSTNAVSTPTELAQGFNSGADSVSTGFGGTAGSSAASIATPSGIDINDPNSSLSSAASSASSASAPVSANVGSGTVGTPSIAGGADGSTFTGFGIQPGGASISGAAEGANSAFTPTTPSSIGNLIDHPSLGNAGKAIADNPRTALSAVGLGVDALKQQTPMKGTNQLDQIAGQENAQSQKLQSYLDSGTLPPGLQGSINQASEAAKATIRSQHASQGTSGSSAEQQELAAVDQRAQAQGAEMGMQLLQTGINEAGMASKLYQQLLNNNLQQDQNLGTAISSFASAAGGGTQKAA